MPHRRGCHLDPDPAPLDGRAAAAGPTNSGQTSRIRATGPLDAPRRPLRTPGSSWRRDAGSFFRRFLNRSGRA